MTPTDRTPTTPSVFVRLLRSIMWSAISLACSVVGAYVMLGPPDRVQHPFEMVPGLDVGSGHDAGCASQTACLRRTA